MAMTRNSIDLVAISTYAIWLIRLVFVKKTISRLLATKKKR